MKLYLNNRSAIRYQLLSLALATGFALPLPALTASVSLATAPLATATNTVIKPNLLFVLDDSGSMSWTFLPDKANNFKGDYGYQSHQCNAVYYNPAITYSPPLDASKVAYADASFIAAKDNGFDSTSTARDLNSEFSIDRYSPEGGSTSSATKPVYYLYSGTQTVPNFFDTSSTFYTECNTSIGSSTSVFSKRRLSSTSTTTIDISGSSSTTVSSIRVNGVELMSGTTASSSSSNDVAAKIAAKIYATGYSATASGSTVTIVGPTSAANYTPVITKSGSMTLTADVFPETDAAKLTNFANWYSYYRTRMLMMKTSAGRAFSTLDNSYRIGLSKINSSSSPIVPIGTFEGTKRSDWYTNFYDTIPGNSTPLREALANSGKYFAGKLAGTDPVQYSCQQNFTILSSDGYWNGNAGTTLTGDAVGNTDGAYTRPYSDGGTPTGGTTVTITYTNNVYTRSTNGCSSGKGKIKTQPKIGSCDVTVTTVTGSESCTPASWSNNGASTTAACATTATPPSPSANVKISAVATLASSGGTSDTLADVAMYYYQTDLRTTALGNCGTGDVLCTNNVFIGANDRNTQQHMTTFTLGLGGSGRMLYSPSYLTGGSADYDAVALGSTASSSVCTWQTSGTVCTWPTPGSDQVENIDDMWHAAVNGHGAYFSATNPTSLAVGLANALAGINTRKGAAAAAATSTLNPVAGNNFAYVASYTTVAWKGNLEARGINTDTGVVNTNAAWCVENVAAGDCALPSTIVAETDGDTTTNYCVTPNSVTCAAGVLDGTNCKVPMATSCTGTMNTKVADTSDTRTIKTANSGGTSLIDFDSAYATANPSHFDATKISTLSQWISLDATQKTTAVGTNLLNFLRGQRGYEDRTSNALGNRLYRAREAVMGDALESQPAFLAKPVFSYPYPGYSTFITSQSAVSTVTAGTVYIGANDGMMHAFAGDTGIERWAYVPSMVIPNMWKLADKNYGGSHANFSNGSPITTDICTANCTDAATAVWKTILVAGLNGGGRGYYALDITNPNSPQLLWEFTTTAGIGIRKDDDLGYSFGNPVVTRKVDGTWVVLVTSGYNNTNPGDGKGYLYVLNAATGAIISKISTGAGTTTTPSGLAKIAGWNNEPAGNSVGYVYGGDLSGNVWRFDINSTSTATVGTGSVMALATLFSDSGGTNPQPITTTPVLGNIANKRVIFVGTGKYLESSDLTSTQIQTQYAIADDNATSTLVNPRNTLVHQTIGASTSGAASRTGTSTDAVNFTTGRGWYLDFPDSGERVNIDSQLVAGTLVVATIVPSSTDCTPGGYGWLNFFDYKTGKAIDTSNVLSLKYDSTIVGINILYVDGKPKVSVVTSTDPTPQQSEKEIKSGLPKYQGKRVIWRELIP